MNNTNARLHIDTTGEAVEFVMFAYGGEYHRYTARDLTEAVTILRSHEDFVHFTRWHIELIGSAADLARIKNTYFGREVRHLNAA